MQNNTLINTTQQQKEKEKEEEERRTYANVWLSADINSSTNCTFSKNHLII